MRFPTSQKALAVLLCLPFVVFGSGQERRGRSIGKMTFPKEPLDIVRVEVDNSRGGKRAVALGKSFEGDDGKWLKALTVVVRNTSAKNIVHIRAELHVMTSDDPPHSVAAPLTFGAIPAEAGGAAAAPAPAKTLAPGETAELVLSDVIYEQFKGLVREKGGKDSFDVAELRFEYVLFDDDTVWSAGRLQRFRKEAPPAGPDAGSVRRAAPRGAAPSLFQTASFRPPVPAAPAAPAQTTTTCYNTPTSTSVTCTYSA